MEGAAANAIDTALLKARSALRWRRPTSETNKLVKAESLAPTFMNDFPQPGALPIILDGQVDWRDGRLERRRREVRGRRDRVGLQGTGDLYRTVRQFPSPNAQQSWEFLAIGTLIVAEIGFWELGIDEGHRLGAMRVSSDSQLSTMFRRAAPRFVLDHDEPLAVPRHVVVRRRDAGAKRISLFDSTSGADTFTSRVVVRSTAIILSPLRSEISLPFEFHSACVPPCVEIVQRRSSAGNGRRYASFCPDSFEMYTSHRPSGESLAPPSYTERVSQRADLVDCAATAS